MTCTGHWIRLVSLWMLVLAPIPCGLGIRAGETPLDEPPLPPAVGASEPSPSAPDPERQVIEMQLAGQDDPSPKLGYGNCQWLYPLEAAPENLRQQPEYRSKNPIYYAARYGDSQDNVFTFVLDHEGNSDVLYVDSDNDHRIDPQKERFDVHLGTTSHADPLRIQLLVTAGGITAPYYVSFTAFPYSDEKSLLEKVHANLRDSSYYQGEAVLLGKRRSIAVADLDSNGLFNDVEDRLFHGDRFFVNLDGDIAAGDRNQHMESFPYGGFTRIAGTWYSIVALPGGSRVEITRVSPPLGRIEASPQIATARLVSPTQPLDLTFADGSDSAVEGTYRVRTLQLFAESKSADRWMLVGSFAGDEPELTVRTGQTARLAAGLPLTVEPQVVVDEDRTLQISLRISGVAGETYRWSPRPGSASNAGFQILDAAGEMIASGEFEYG